MPYRIALAVALAAGLAAVPAIAQQGGSLAVPAPSSGGRAPAVPNYENAASGGAMTRGPGVADTAGAATGTVGGGPGLGLPNPAGGPGR